MIKNYILSFFLFCIAMISSYAQIIENFDGWTTDTGYGGVATYTSASGIWETNNALCDTQNSRSGRVVRFNDDSGENEYLLYSGLDGNGKDGGIGEITFWYRHWNGDGSNLEFQVQYSINSGTSWVNVGSVVNSPLTTYTQFSSTVNLSGDNILVQVISIDDEERFLIDDFEITDFSSCTDEVDFANIQFPNTTQTIISGTVFDVYAQCYEPGVTDTPNNQGAGIVAWIGYNTIGANHPPSSATGWTWVATTYNDTGGNNDEYTADIGSLILTSGTYYYASRFQLNGCNYIYGGSGGIWNDDSVQLNVSADQVDFCNVDFPKMATITVGSTHDVYAQGYEPGLTNAAGQGANLEAWIGYNTIGIDHQPWDPTGWTWIPATYDSDIGNNDQYVAEIGSALSVGTYYYASRFQLNGSDYSYGGIDSDNVGNFWDATNNSGVLTVTNAPCADLIISEYVEGSGNNKYIEIFNGTGSTINLSTYEFQFYNNGSATLTNSFPLSGNILDGNTIVYQDNSATLYGGATTSFPAFMSFNGDDAIALVNNSTIIDVIGEIGFDPGTAWTGGSSSTLNRTLRRKSTVQVGDADGSNVFAPNVEWDTYPINSVDDLGFHFSSCHPDMEIQLNINSTNVACGFIYNYGNQLIDTNTDVLLTIQNLGDIDLEITDLYFATGTDYSLVGAPATPFTIPATSSQNITIRFNPNALGIFSDTLTIESDDASESFCDINLTGISSSNCATTTTVFALQDFESAPSDTWNYTADHAPISGYWAVTSSLSNIVTAQNGSNFWGITDLERSGHTNQTHELSFSQSLAGFTNVQLEFHYYTIEIDASDSFEYELFFDGVSQGVNDISADTGAWTEVLVNIPDAVGTLDIIFYADIDATNDQAGIDNLSLSSTTINTVTWDGTNWDWNDGVTPQNTLPNSSSFVILDAPFNTATAGLQQSFTSCSLTINNVLLTINDGHSIEVENSLIVNGVGGAINIEPQGSFVQINDSGTVTATTPTNLTVSKLTAPANNWYEYTYWSSPVFEETPLVGLANAHSARRYQFNAQYFRDSTYENLNDNTTTAGAGVDDVDDNGDDWGGISTPYLVPGVGYAATHDPTVFASTLGCPGPTCGIRYTFSGLFNNGVITVPLYRNDTESGDNNWNFVGNPYPSAISADAFLTTNMGIVGGIPEPNPIIEGAIYLWSQNTPPSDTTNGNENLNFSQSDYAIINGTGEIAAQNNGGDSTVPSRYIPSGQGFFIVMDNAASPTTQVLPTPVSGENIQTADLVFNNAMRVTDNNNQFFRNASSTNTNNKLWVNLSTDNGAFSQVLVGYLDNATDNYDGMYFDAPRNASTNTNAIIYSSIPYEEKIFAIQGKNSNSLNLEEIIPLGFYTTIEEPTIYSLSIAQLEGEFMTENTIYLKDNILNTIHDLSSSNYSFISESGKFNERFEIVFTPSTLSIDDKLIDTNALTIVELPNGDVEFKLNSNKNVISKVEILDALGRRIYNLNGGNATEVYNLSQLSQSAYIAKITLSNGQVISKKAIKQR